MLQRLSQRMHKARGQGGFTLIELAQANVRSSIPAVEAYFADNNSYAGATLAYLQTTYDQGVKNIVIQSATATTYCVESTVGAETFKKAGPGADIVTGACP
jgi:Tfp pilus assembly protein PilE